ncbi:MAG TPA: polysaccharide deacetylase family protein [Xanthobacteraceae bacterium]|nr:polysaccharide deacetylase family protein [Xanthobacteraceae bacterium]
MSALKTAIFRAGLEALYFSGGHLWLRPFLGGIGCILTLHHVRPRRLDAFQPNRPLEVTPRFLENTIRKLRDADVDFVGVDEMHRRLTQRDFRKRFVCLTFDDGYRDTKEYAYPVLKKYGVPLSIYIPTSFPDRIGELWWLVLEAVLVMNDRIGLVIDGEDRRFDCHTVSEKQHIYHQIYWWLRGQTESELRSIIRELAARYQIDIASFCENLCMNWRELTELAQDPLVTIGAHTVNHVRLAKVPESEARAEMEMSASVLAAALGKRPEHLSYPIGDPTSAGPREFAIARELGFKTAVTSRPGMLFPQHRQNLTALPRISLSGEYQQPRYVQVLASGAATTLWNGFRRIHAA